MHARLWTFIIVALFTTTRIILALPGDTDSSFNANVSNGTVWAAAPQPDGRIVIVGDFTTVGGQTRNRVARLNADGSLDTAFNPNANGIVTCVVIQPDGKILIGGAFSTVGGQGRNNYARLNADGTPESTTTFFMGTGTVGEVDGILVQPDGKIILTGFLTSVNTQSRNYIARLNADGTLEGSGTFNIGTGAGNSILGAALQPDGKIIISGNFTTFNGTARNRLARLNANGTLEGTGTFNIGTGLNGPAQAIVVQPDGMIWLGGDFFTVNGVTINRLVRLNSDGTTATALTGSPATIRCLALQTDGKLLLGGDFTALNGQARGRIARLDASGALEGTGTFNIGTGADNIVRGLTLLPNGKILVSGGYTNFAGNSTRPRITRLDNDAAPATLTIAPPALVQWSRGGAGPEVLRTTLELSTNGGASFTPLGNGTRVAGGWELNDLSLPTSGLIRARGLVTAGNQNGSSGFVEQLAYFPPQPEIVVEQPAGTGLTDNSATINFGSGMTGTTSTAKVFTIKNTGTLNLNGLAVTKDGVAAADYSIDVTGMSTTVVPGGSTTFSVTFTPSVLGTRTATLRIASDDPDENPFDIALTGDGLFASQVAQQAYAKASNTGGDDAFGAAVAISGDTVVVGAQREDSSATGVGGSQADNTATDAGAVYVFTRSAGVWTQQAYIKASNTGGGDLFGNSVALAGDTLVVGAIGEDSNATGVGGNQADNSALSAGAAYVFTRSAGVWTQQAYLKASNTDAGDQFGTSVSISGDTIIVGAQFEDSNATGIGGNQADNSLTDAGAAYIFTRSAGVWTQQAYVKASNSSGSDLFGVSVGVSGDSAVVGGHGDDSNATGIGGNQADNSAVDSGAIYVFTRSGTTWSQQAYIKPSNTGAGDLFGGAVAIDGDTIVAGAIREDSVATGIGGNQTDNSAGDAGAAYLFTRSGVTWTQQAYMKASNTGGNDNFGRSVALSSDTLVIGAHLEDSAATGVGGSEADNTATDAGAAYVFIRTGSIWMQQAYAKASNTGTGGDQFGYAVAASSGTAVVGAPSEDSIASGIGGNQADNSAAQAGAAYIFTGVGPADIKVEQPVGTTLVDGSASIDFGSENVGASGVPKTFTITNTGAGPLLAITIAKDGANATDFTIDTTGMSTSLAAGASTTFSVTFAPSAVGARAAALHINGNDMDESPFDIALTGTGVVAPEIGVEQPAGTGLPSTGASVAFGNVPTSASSSPKVFTIKNTGNAALGITSVSVTGGASTEFSVDTSGMASSVPTFTGSTTFSVTFTPTAIGLRQTTLRIVSDDSDEGVIDITLSGSGVVPANANLSNLSMGGGSFAPFFQANVTSYSSLVANATTSVTVTPTAAAGGSTITVNSQPVTSGTASPALNLSVGVNAITIVVTASDNVTTKTYTLNVTRAAPPGPPGPGSVDSSFTANVTGTIRATVMQPDGKVIVCGDFSAIAGQSRNHIARLNADGALESTATFNTGTGPNDDVLNATVQNDGKILVAGYFTTWNGQPRNYLTRLNADGTADGTFNIGSGPNATPYGTWEQPDGKILLWGLFTSVNGVSRNRLARLNSDGTLESTATFDVGTGANHEIDGAALQPDGKILVGGLFTQFNGQSRNHIARLNSDGSVESLATFNPGTGVDGVAPFGRRLFSILPQPDGKILLTGEFITVDGQPRSCIARINSDGTLENTATFNIGSGAEGGEVRSIALQTDGKIVLGGFFSTISGQLRNNLVRLNTDGSVESTSTFDPGSGPLGNPYGVLSTALLPDGKILVGGTFQDLNGTSRQSLARILNGPATQSIAVTSQSRVEWLRGGTSPEVTQVTFDMSQDGGATWTPLGAGSRISGGWEIVGLNLPAHGYRVRGRGRISSCDLNGSCGMVESSILVPTTTSNFRQTYFGSPDNTGDAADLADPDGDGIVNLLEFAFGMNPILPSAGQLPQPVLANDSLTLSFTQPVNIGGIIYGAEYSLDLGEWHPIADTGTGGNHVFSVPTGTADGAFIRIKIIPN